MRIHIGISMTRKMFDISQYTLALHSSQKTQPLMPYIVAIFPKRAISYDWIFRIDVNIDIRRKIQVNSNTPGLLPQTYPERTDKFIISNGSKRQIPGKSI